MKNRTRIILFCLLIIFLLCLILAISISWIKTWEAKEFIFASLFTAWCLCYAIENIKTCIKNNMISFNKLALVNSICLISSLSVFAEELHSIVLNFSFPISFIIANIYLLVILFKSKTMNGSLIDKD